VEDDVSPTFKAARPRTREAIAREHKIPERKRHAAAQRKRPDGRELWPSSLGESKPNARECPTFDDHKITTPALLSRPTISSF